MITVKEFARKEGISTQTVYKSISNKNGKYKPYTVIINGKTMIDYELYKNSCLLQKVNTEVNTETPAITSKVDTFNTKSNNSCLTVDKLIETYEKQIEDLQKDKEALNHDKEVLTEQLRNLNTDVQHWRGLAEEYYKQLPSPRTEEADAIIPEEPTPDKKPGFLRFWKKKKPKR